MTKKTVDGIKEEKREERQYKEDKKGKNSEKWQLSNSGDKEGICEKWQKVGEK